MASGRNRLCDCGSGRKLKHCCATVSHSILTPGLISLGFIVIVGAILALVTLLNVPDDRSIPGPVWSEEHVHWHDAPGLDPVTLLL